MIFYCEKTNKQTFSLYVDCSKFSPEVISTIIGHFQVYNQDVSFSSKSSKTLVFNIQSAFSSECRDFDISSFPINSN